MADFGQKTTNCRDHFIRYRQPKIKREYPMTICIATICEQNTGTPRIVFASDRLVTDQDGYTFELGVPKLKLIAHHCILMEAGDSFRGELILEKWKEKVPDFEQANKMRHSEIINILRLCYKEIFNESLETEIFSPRGLTRQGFYEDFAKFPEWYGFMTDFKVESFNFGVTFIATGIDIDHKNDLTMGRLTRFSGRGQPEILDSLGFAMAGIGEKMSFPELTRNRYSPNDTLAEALVRTYWAKRSAERMIGVGTKTDFGMMWLETDKDEQIVCKNTLFEDKIVKELFDKEFENSRVAADQMTKSVKDNIDDILKGTKKLEFK
jgi:hypothetical protein